MGLIDIIMLLSTIQSSVANKSQQHQEKISWERQELNPGLIGEKQVCYLCAMQPQPWSILLGAFSKFPLKAIELYYFLIDVFSSLLITHLIEPFEPGKKAHWAFGILGSV